ncbi:MAG: hypothetical protein HRU69_15210 [Flammeovirgaceae bacterium]|nr:MAG: hypothetical protein HRU69_15210 [Flammeovirgaceae bacterium]
MKETHDYQHDIASIREVMERSSKFLSLSGLSGVMAGVYALAGAVVAYHLLYYPQAPLGSPPVTATQAVILRLLTLASAVLVLSIGTAIAMSYRKAKRAGSSIWNKTSRQLLALLGMPLVTGGLLILTFIINKYFALIAPACLVFYGLALVNASSITVKEIGYLGFSQLLLGLVAALLPGYGLIFWGVGFGVLHIIYGAVMHYRYDL